ncbi:hypothetical protein F511_29364 [Dorcoceras hygrometricum]|uniref:Uncharacterized protein n=1 Tax=Dorcoceras hygrometricum TaxID=472368 RepID=A0A2Z7CK75_9LAMI|nr:hypothetical protein F511_29364 [Dorcoceras hygrometricum]
MDTTAFCLHAKGSIDGFYDGNNQQVATVHLDEKYSSLYTQTQATVIQSQALQDQRLDNQLQAHLHQLVNQSLAHLDHQLMYQSQATVYPIVGYNVMHNQSTKNPDAEKRRK